MTPRILPRAEHPVSRKNIDPEALKVLYRLKSHSFIAYLVGGGVRDLLLGRRPKDFDIATDAHPQQVKRLFRNCFVVGRRFRLCHVRFGHKVVEVSTFRRQALEDHDDPMIRRDNTFGTPEEDAFRRDFTVNALFYDIATFSVIDYVGGLDDVAARVIRTIGDPAVRFREDPVRMLRAVALASRLGFRIDPDSMDAIRHLRGDIVKSSPARLLEEVYKILRHGAARPTFQALHDTGLLAYLMPEAHDAVAEGRGELLASLGRLDAYRARPDVSPDDLSNSLLLGTLLAPLGLPRRAAPVSRRSGERRRGREEGPAEEHEEPLDVAAEMAALGAHEGEGHPTGPDSLAPVSLPFARRDLDRVRLVLAAQNRLRELHSSPRVRQLMAARSYLDEALRWLEIHGGDRGPALAAEWREALAAGAASLPAEPEPEAAPEPQAEASPGRPRRRRRRRRPRPDAPPAA